MLHLRALPSQMTFFTLSGPVLLTNPTSDFRSATLSHRSLRSIEEGHVVQQTSRQDAAITAIITVHRAQQNLHHCQKSTSSPYYRLTRLHVRSIDRLDLSRLCRLTRLQRLSIDLIDFKAYDITFTADPTWPSYSLLPHLLPFSTYHNLDFIHTDSHAFTLHVIFPVIKSFNQLLFSFSYHCQVISIQQLPYCMLT